MPWDPHRQQFDPSGSLPSVYGLEEGTPYIHVILGDLSLRCEEVEVALTNIGLRINFSEAWDDTAGNAQLFIRLFNYWEDGVMETALGKVQHELERLSQVYPALPFESAEIKYVGDLA